MIRRLAMIGALGGGLLALPAMAAAGPYAGACLTAPVFTENFAAPGIGAQWTPIVHPAIPNPNRELQAYQADAVTTGAQGLRISARRRAGGYVSGSITSKATYRYGCFDIVARMPAGRGLWPALWLRTLYGQPLDGEIDIMEGFGSHPGVFQSTLHHWAAGVHHGFSCTRIGDWRSSVFGMRSACGWQPRWAAADFITAPHHYGLIWTPHAVTWLIDGAPFYTLHGGVPDQAMAIVLNLAVGGIFDGDPDARTVFPADMTVRSITVWPIQP